MTDRQTGSEKVGWKEDGKESNSRGEKRGDGVGGPQAREEEKNMSREGEKMGQEERKGMKRRIRKEY